MPREFDMTQRKNKRYLTKRSGDFVNATKLKIARILADGGWKQDLISRETGFPQGSISKKLNPNNSQMMDLADMVVLADFLNITVREMLPEPEWRTMDQERYNYMLQLMELPIDHVKYLIEHYNTMKELLEKRG